MARPSAQQLGTFMSAVLVYLGQPRWKIILLDERTDATEGTPDGDEPWAETSYGQISMVVELWLSADVRDNLDMKTVREIMVHEALHSIHNGIDNVVLRQQDMMHDHEWERMMGDYHRERERMVYALALAISETAEIKKLWREHCGRPSA